MRAPFFFALLALVAAPDARAQGRDSLIRREAPHWTAGALLQYERVEGPPSDWQTLDAHLTHKVHGRSWSVGLVHVRRFDQADVAGLADLYQDFGRGAYGNLRLQASPGATVTARADVLAMGFVPAARVWEVGAGVRGLWFERERVALFTGSVGRYVGNYFVVGRATVAPRDGGAGRSALLLVRRYFATPGAFAEVQAGGGREVVTLGAGPRVDVRQTRFAAARLYAPLTGPLWLTAGAGYTDDEAFPRATATAGLDVRW